MNPYNKEEDPRARGSRGPEKCRRFPGDAYEQESTEDTMPLTVADVRRAMRADQAARQARNAQARNAEEANEGYRYRPTSANVPNEGKPRKKKSCLGRLFRLFLLLLVVSTIALAIYLFLWDQEKEALPVPAADEGNTLAPIQDDLLVLLAGVDDTGSGQPQRTDTLLLLRFAFKEGRLIGLSIPRDSRVYVKGELDKINHAHAYGGIELTMKTIRDFLGVDLDYYVEVDYETVKAVVDAAGGVRYDVPEKAAPVPGEIHRVGDHVLDGPEALSFLRHRQGYRNGDLDRVKAQQAFIRETAKQVVSPLRFYRYPLVLHAFRTNAKTNLPALPLLPKAPGVLFSGLSNMELHTVPGDGQMIDGVSYYVVDSEDTEELVNELFAPFVF